MDEISLISVLGLAFSLGMIHALDADHIAAVCGLASTRLGHRKSLAFCVRWAAGHGVTVLALGTVAILVGQTIPEKLSQTAEDLVGLVLIGIGLWVLWDLRRNHVHLHIHQHGGLLKHAHWHKHQDKKEADPSEHHRHGHGAVMVGMLHGTAGLAPLLALVPLTSHTSAWGAIAYLALFGLGVLVSMLIFGGLVGIIFNRALQQGETMVNYIRGGAAVFSMGLGVFLLQGAF